MTTFWGKISDLAIADANNNTDKARLARIENRGFSSGFLSIGVESISDIGN
jgi:hypothetical protein